MRSEAGGLLDYHRQSKIVVSHFYTSYGYGSWNGVRLKKEIYTVQSPLPFFQINEVVYTIGRQE